VVAVCRSLLNAGLLPHCNLSGAPASVLSFFFVFFFFFFFFNLGRLCLFEDAVRGDGVPVSDGEGCGYGAWCKGSVQLLAAWLIIERLLRPSRDGATPDLAGRRVLLASRHSTPQQSLINHGKHKAAEIIFTEVHAGRQALLGREHPDTLRTANNLAHSLKSQGNPAAAVSIYRSVLAAEQVLHGDDHPETLSTAHNLGSALDEDGKYVANSTMPQQAM
jgi:hypothetical protein